jgi:hypothetical protein
MTIGRWASVLVGLLLLALSCSEMYAHRPIGASIELAENCAAGPYCVTGAVSAENGTPVPGVRCTAEWSEEEPTVVFSDRHGLFMMDGLRYLPRHLRFEREGFEAQPVSVVDVLRGHAASPDDAGSEAPLTTTGPLIGEGEVAADEVPADQLFDFGNGSTMRVLVTMRHAP